MSATLPGFSDRRRTNWRAGPSVRMSACAAAKPSSDSARTVSTWLISFFMAGSWRWAVEDLSERVANGADEQCRGTRTGIDMPERALAQERCASSGRFDLRRGGGAVHRALAHAC